MVDLTGAGLDRHPRFGSAGGQPRILVAGALRTDTLRLQRPHSGMARRAERAVDRLTGAGLLELTSGHGTDLAIDLSGAAVTSDTGIVCFDRPVARWPAGQVTVSPAAGKVTGTIIAMPRDLYLEIGGYVRSPLTLSIRNDHIADVTGSAGDADLLRSLLASSGSVDGFGIAAVSIGLSNERIARAGPQSFAPYLDPLAAPRGAGTITIAFGANPTAHRLKGERVTLVVHGHSLAADGRPLVVSGELQGDLRPDVYEAAGGTGPRP